MEDELTKLNDMAQREFLDMFQKALEEAVEKFGTTDVAYRTRLNEDYTLTFEFFKGPFEKKPLVFFND